MSLFDYSNPAHLKARKFRTRAMMAALYAQEANFGFNAAAWTYNAESLNDLADITERSSTFPSSERLGGPY